MSKEITPYQMCINNIAMHLRSRVNVDDSHVSINAFHCGEVIAIAFCKFKEDVIADIINADVLGKEHANLTSAET